jgi:hypothetical protein
MNEAKLKREVNYLKQNSTLNFSTSLLLVYCYESKINLCILNLLLW